jgi:NAD(P)-dependent dehydrogenase (short-subunit alcohol dehydrogenase family)
MNDTTGWVAVVTGAGSGIGRGMARAFAGAGMRLVLADIQDGPLDEAVAELEAAGAEVIGRRTDVSKLDAVQALADAAVARFGEVNVVCANAGVGMANPIWATSLDDWRWTIDVDLWGPIYTMHVFAPLVMGSGKGHLNATASMAGLLAGGSLGAYNVAKHGVVALMASLARDLMIARSPVRASVLCPGPINTNIVNSQRVRAEGEGSEPTPQGQRFWANLAKTLAHGMDPNEVGRLVLGAIQRDEFWVFTHPEMLEVVQAQLDLARSTRALQRF